MSRQSPNEETVVLKVCNEDYFFPPLCTTSSTFKRAPQDQLTLVVSCSIWLLCKCWSGAKEFSLSRDSARQRRAWSSPLALESCLDPRVREEGKITFCKKDRKNCKGRLLILPFVTAEMCCWGSWEGSSAPLLTLCRGCGKDRQPQEHWGWCFALYYKHITRFVEPLMDLFPSQYLTEAPSLVFVSLGWLLKHYVSVKLLPSLWEYSKEQCRIPLAEKVNAFSNRKRNPYENLNRVLWNVNNCFFH